MADAKSSGGNLFVSLLIFALTAGIALLLLLAAGVIGLAEWWGSLPLALLAAGGLFALIALLLYFMEVRKPMRRLRERAETIYEVAQLLQRGYDWVSDRLRWLRSFWETLTARGEDPAEPDPENKEGVSNA